jgi:hypothetical protein
MDRIDDSVRHAGTSSLGLSAHTGTYALLVHSGLVQERTNGLDFQIATKGILCQFLS